MQNSVPLKSEPLDRIIRPFQEFAHTASSGGILLLVLTAIALFWANSPFAQSYRDVWHAPTTVGIGPFVLSKPLELWINDGLMAVFFFVVGLEIKREILTGELSSVRQAALPILAAAGGMAIPALVYVSLNAGTPEITGWGIPMATDIAFSLGILALLGKAVPDSLKVFLTALAIVDDLGAVLVIALFYTSSISFAALKIGLGFLAVMALANRLGVRTPLVYFVLGVGAWLGFLLSGVHATISGVLAAMTIPARQRIDHESLVLSGRALLDEIERSSTPEHDSKTLEERRRAAIQALDNACEHLETPLQRLEHRLHPWVAFFVMPVFALANAGVPLGADFVGSLAKPVTLGVALGLVVGKQVGVTAFSWLAVRAGWAGLPAGVSWPMLYAVSWLAGVGFTMSLFIISLAFEDEPTLVAARSGVLVASLIAGVIGYLLLKRSTRTGMAEA